MTGFQRVTAGVAMLLLLCACVSVHPPHERFTIVQQREPMSLNAALENGASSTELGLLLYTYLLKWDDRGQLVGDVATAVPTLANGGISSDGKTITYHLRKGVRFSDGVALTATDCVYSIQAILNPRNNVQTRYGYDRVLRADAPNPTTLVLHLREPFAPLLTLVLAPQGFPILPRHLLASLPDFNTSTFNQRPVGAGPYMVRAWARGDRVELDANPYYFHGRPAIAHLTIRFVPDASTAMNQLRTGEADGFFNDQDLEDFPLLRSIPRVHTTNLPLNAVGALLFNTRDPITSDARVRRALTDAIDIPSLVAKTYRGAVDARDAGRGLFEWAYDASAPLATRHSPAEAQRLLDAAGWVPGRDGIRIKNGARLSLTLAIQANTPGDSALASEIQQYEKAVGVEVIIRAYEVTLFVAPASAGGPIYGGHFQVAYYPFVNGDDPDVTDQFACANVPPNGYNKSRYCDPRLDDALRAARSTYDPPQRRAAYARAQHMLSQALPIVLLYQRREIDAFSTHLRHQTTSVSTAFWNVGAWNLAP